MVLQFLGGGVGSDLLLLNSGCPVSRQTAEVGGEELSWVQSSVDEVIAMLQQSPGLPSVPEVSALVVSWFVIARLCRGFRFKYELKSF